MKYLLLLLTATIGHADQRWHIGLGTGTSTDSSDDVAIQRATVGFRSDEIAFELGVNNYDDEATGLDLSMLVIAPVPVVEPFFRLGYHYTNLRNPSFGFDGLVYGLGVIAEPTDRLRLTGEWVVTEGGPLLQDSRSYQIGAAYRF